MFRRFKYYYKNCISLIMKIVSLKFFTIIYIELHDYLAISTRLFIYIISVIIHYIQYNHHGHTIVYLRQHDCLSWSNNCLSYGQPDHLMYIISLHDRLLLYCDMKPLGIGSKNHVKQQDSKNTTPIAPKSI